MSVKRYDVMSYSLDVDGNTGPFVKYEDYAALEARCAALAAENAGMKDAIETHKHGFVRCNCCGDELMYHTDDVCRALDDTPATDAFLAEVRAQGVEIFAQWCRGERDFTLIDEDISDAAAYEECIKRAEYFAAHLRKGVQS